MPTTLRREVLDVAESPLLVIGGLADQMPGSIKLCYGESDAPTPDFIVRAADEAARGGHTFYTHTAGYPELRDAIAAKVHELHGVEYRGSEIMSTVGASMAIYAAIRARPRPGAAGDRRPHTIAHDQQSEQSHGLGRVGRGASSAGRSGRRA
jgi:DNA-binding transcriptional MocR family regulator